MQKKVIISLCSGTGSWEKPYVESGYYEVIPVTLPDNDVRTWQLPDKPIYGILAAPPCTMFSLARTRAKKPRDLREGMELVEACMRLIWEARKRNKLAFWAMENPRGILRQFLGVPQLTFDPCDYGDAYTKKTDLWGYYNLPKKKPVDPVWVWDKKHRVRMSPNHFHSSGNTDKGKEYRSITPQGFATAFYKANR